MDNVTLAQAIRDEVASLISPVGDDFQIVGPLRRDISGGPISSFAVLEVDPKHGRPTGSVWEVTVRAL